MESKVYDITVDRYHNEIERVINLNGDYRKIQRQYNNNNQLTSCIEYDINEDIISRVDISYRYDLHGNIVSIIEKNKFKYFSNIIEKKFEYINIYIDDKLISKTKYENNKILEIYEYIYKDKKLVKSIETLNSCGNMSQRIHLNTYLRDKNDIVEHIWLDNGVISCRLHYEKLKDGKLRHTLADPWNGKYSWRIRDINDLECFVDILESVLFPDLLIEICECLMTAFPDIKSLILDIGDSEDVTYCKEIIEMEDHYRNKTGINICRIM